MRWLRDQLDRVLWGHVIAAGGDVLGFALLLAALAMLALWTSSCSTGPQLPVTTPVLHISCTWNLQDGGTAEDCDCLVDRSASSAEAQTTGNETGPVEVSPRTSVSATGGTP